MSHEMNKNKTACKNIWKPEEDKKLLELVEIYGSEQKWTQIASELHAFLNSSRTGKQCRERYHNHLRPEISKISWTREEDDLLTTLQKEYGNQWSKISKYFPGRSDNAIKNRWHIRQRYKKYSKMFPKEIDLTTESDVVSISSRPEVPLLNLPSKKPMTKKNAPTIPKLQLPSSKSSEEVAVVHSCQSTERKMVTVHESRLKLMADPTNADLLVLYHSHCEFRHELTLSSRSNPLCVRQVSPCGNIKSERHVVPLLSTGLDCDNNNNNNDEEDEEESWLDDILDNELFLYTYRSEGEETLYSALLSSRSLPMTIREGIFDEEDDNDNNNNLLTDRFSQPATSARDDFFLEPLDNQQSLSLFDSCHFLLPSDNNNYDNNNINGNNNTMKMSNVTIDRQQLCQFKNLVQRLRLTPRSPCQNPKDYKRARPVTNLSPRLTE